jgi:hypothetical protein
MKEIADLLDTKITKIDRDKGYYIEKGYEVRTDK